MIIIPLLLISTLHMRISKFIAYIMYICKELNCEETSRVQRLTRRRMNLNGVASLLGCYINHSPSLWPFSPLYSLGHRESRYIRCQQKPILCFLLKLRELTEKEKTQTIILPQNENELAGETARGEIAKNARSFSAICDPDSHETAGSIPSPRLQLWQKLGSMPRKSLLLRG